MVDAPAPTPAPAKAATPTQAAPAAPATAAVIPAAMQAAPGVPADPKGAVNPAAPTPPQRAAPQVEPAGKGDPRPVQVEPAPPEGFPAGSDQVDLSEVSDKEAYEKLKAARKQGRPVTFVTNFDPETQADSNFPYHPATAMGENVSTISEKTRAEQEQGRAKLQRHKASSDAEASRGQANVARASRDGERHMGSPTEPSTTIEK